jgi:hypothetical protein
MSIWFVAADDEDWDSSITHVTHEEYDSSTFFEPYPCAMPGCEDLFEQPVTVLQFYTHMEEHAHLRWLFDTFSNTCSFGCEKGFFNAHSLLRHYLSGDCQGLTESVSHSPTREDVCNACGYKNAQYFRETG